MGKSFKILLHAVVACGSLVSFSSSFAEDDNNDKNRQKNTDGKYNLNQVKKIHYGTISMPSAAAGTINIDSNGDIQKQGFLHDDKTHVQKANFEISGPPDSAVFVTVDKTASISNGNKTFDVKLNNNSHTVQKMDSKGIAQFEVAGNLTLPENLPDGVYSGHYNITVHY